MGPIVVRLEGEPAFRANHPHPITNGEAPQQRSELAASDESDVELIAVRTGDIGIGGDREWSLNDPSIGEYANSHVLTRLERLPVGIESDPEIGERVVLVDAPNQRRVVLGRRRIDHSRIGGGSLRHHQFILELEPVLQ